MEVSQLGTGSSRQSGVGGGVGGVSVGMRGWVVSLERVQNPKTLLREFKAC